MPGANNVGYPEKQQRTAEETVDRARDHARTYHLHRLATALDTQGLHATVKTSYPAALHIFAPGATMLAESIGCTPGTDDRGHLRSSRWPCTGKWIGASLRRHAGAVLEFVAPARTGIRVSLIPAIWVLGEGC